MSNIGIDTVYTDIMTQLNSLKDCNGEYIFKKVAIFNNQIERYKLGAGYEFNFPACFLQMKMNRGYSLGNQATTNDIEIILHIAHWELDDMVGNLDQNLNVFTIRDYVKRGLTLFKPTGSTALMWGGDTQDFDHGNIYVIKCRFLTRYIDVTAMPCEHVYDGPTASIVITATYSGWLGSYPITNFGS